MLNGTSKWESVYSRNTLNLELSAIYAKKKEYSAVLHENVDVIYGILCICELAENSL